MFFVANITNKGQYLTPCVRDYVQSTLLISSDQYTISQARLAQINWSFDLGLLLQSSIVSAEVGGGKKR